MRPKVFSIRKELFILFYMLYSSHGKKNTFVPLSFVCDEVFKFDENFLENKVHISLQVKINNWFHEKVDHSNN